MGMRIVKAILKHSSEVQTRTPLSLKPGREGKRFVVMNPSPLSLYKGPMDDKKIKPATIGGTWTPAAYDATSSKPEAVVDVVLHFHGGAYVVGDGRDHDTGFLAKTIHKHSRVTHVFTPQYRLSSNRGGHFPAALQDALTSYSHLIHTLHIPPSRITISGDSAGANLALALLRYLSEYGQELDLPWPACIWLWSPWVNIARSLDPQNFGRNPNHTTDYLCGSFGAWGASTFAEKHNPRDPYLSPLGHPFRSQSPIWVQCGEAEVLYADDTAIAKEFEGVEGNRVELLVKEAMPHDIILVGGLLGFHREAAECVKKAGEFLRENRKL
jgi:acetyl esterase/lipase